MSFYRILRFGYVFECFQGQKNKTGQIGAKEVQKSEYGSLQMHQHGPPC